MIVQDHDEEARRKNKAPCRSFIGKAIIIEEERSDACLNSLVYLMCQGITR
jgi:hypothetical protein